MWWYNKLLMTTACTGTNAHRTRTPLLVSTTEEAGSITLDASQHKNWHLNLGHSTTTLLLTNVISGRRGHVVIDNTTAAPVTLNLANSGALYFNANGATTATDAEGIISVTITTHVVLRYYSDLTKIVIVVDVVA